VSGSPIDSARPSRTYRSLWGSEMRFGVSCGQLRSDVVLMGESAEDLFPVDPVLGQVDRLGWAGLCLSRGELAEGAMRPGRVVVHQVLSQHPAQVVLVDDQQPVEEFPAQGADDPLAAVDSLTANDALWPLVIRSEDWAVSTLGFTTLMATGSEVVLPCLLSVTPVSE
jgi:hypothetical protein